jgi:hypothetical protein
VKNILDDVGTFGLSYLNSFFGTAGVKINSLLMNNNFMRRRMNNDDSMWYVTLNFTEDKTRGGPESWMQNINNQEAIKARLIENNIPPEAWADLIGTDPENPKSFAQFEQDLVAVLLADERLEEKYGSWAGWTAGVLTDAAGAVLLSEVIGAPIAAAVGRGIAGSEAAYAASRTASAVGWGAAASVESSIVQLLREGIDPNSRPDMADILLEQGVAVGLGGGLGALFGGSGLRGILNRFRGVEQEIPFNGGPDVGPVSGAEAVFGPRRLRGPRRVTPDTNYRMLVDGRYGEHLHASQDVPLLEGSSASIADNVDDIADAVLRTHQSGQRGGSMMNDLLDEMADSGVTPSNDVARAMARSFVRRWYRGQRGVELRNGVLEDIGDLVGRDNSTKLIGQVDRKALPAGKYASDIAVSGPGIPNRGPVLDLIDILKDPARTARVGKNSPVIKIVSMIQKKIGTILNETQIDDVLSDLYTLSRRGGPVRDGIKDILVKYFPQGARIAVPKELVRQVEQLYGRPKGPQTGDLFEPSSPVPQIPVPRQPLSLEPAFYHGAADEITALTEGYYSNRNLYGNGFYTTDNEMVAISYTPKNQSPKDTAAEDKRSLYMVVEKSPVKFVDLDAPITPEISGVLAKFFDTSNSLAVAVDELEEALARTPADVERVPYTLSQVMDVTKKVSRGQLESRDDVTQTFDNIAEELKKLGYGGYTHVGGKRKALREQRHRVKIYWDPKNQIQLVKKGKKLVDGQVFHTLEGLEDAKALQAWSSSQWDQITKIPERPGTISDEMLQLQSRGYITSDGQLIDIIKYAAKNSLDDAQMVDLLLDMSEHVNNIGLALKEAGVFPSFNNDVWDDATGSLVDYHFKDVVVEAPLVDPIQPPQEYFGQIGNDGMVPVEAAPNVEGLIGPVVPSVAREINWIFKSAQQAAPSNMSVADIPQVTAGVTPVPAGQVSGAAGTALPGGAVGQPVATVPPSAVPVPPPAAAVPPPSGTVLSRAHALDDTVPFLDNFQVPPGWKNLGNQAAAAGNHANPLVRHLGYTTIWARRIFQTGNGNTVTQPMSILEDGTENLNGFLIRINELARRRFIQSATGGNSNDRTTVAIAIRDSLNPMQARPRNRRSVFYGNVIDRVRGNAPLNPADATDQAAIEAREVIKDIYMQAHNANVPGFRSLPDPQYFPRIYEWENISQLASTPQGMQALQQLAEELLTTTYVGGVPARQVAWENGTVDVFTDIPEAAAILVRSWLDIHSDTVGRTGDRVTRFSPLSEHDQYIYDALQASQGPLSGGAGRSRSVHGKPRIMMNENAVVNLPAPVRNGNANINQLSLADITSRDLPRVLRKYAISVQGAVNLHRIVEAYNELFVAMDYRAPVGSPNTHVRIESTGEIIATANNFARIDRNRFGQDLSPSDREVINNILDAAAYRPMFDVAAMTTARRVTEEVMGVVNTLTYIGSGGGFGYVSIGESARTMGMFGARATMRMIAPVTWEMIRSWANMNDPRFNVFHALDAIFHPNTERRLKALYLSAAPEGEEQQFGNITRRVGAAVSSAFADATLLNPLTSWLHMLNFMVSMRHLMDVADGNANPLDDATLTLLGVTRQEYDDLVNWGRTNIQRTTRLGVLVPVNVTNMNTQPGQLFRQFAHRARVHNIQDMPTQGDFGKWAFTGLGQWFTMFRKFNLKGIDNFMLANMDRMRFGDAQGRLRVGRTILTVGLAGGLLAYGRQLMEYQTAVNAKNYKKAKEIEEMHLSPVGIARGIANSISELFLPAMIVDNGIWRPLVSDEPVFSAYGENPLDITGLPAVQTINRAYSVTGDLYGEAMYQADMAEDRQRRFTIKTAKDMYRMTGLRSIPTFGQIGEIKVEDWLREMYFPEDQPREPSSSFIKRAIKGQRQ